MVNVKNVQIMKLRLVIAAYAKDYKDQANA